MIDADDLGAPRVGLKTQVKSGLSGLAVRTPLHGGPFQLICISDSEESNDLANLNKKPNAHKPTSNTDKDNDSDVICESEEVDLTDEVGSERDVETPNNINKRRSSQLATENGNIVLNDPGDTSENCNDINKNPPLHTSVDKSDAEILKQKEDVCLADVACESELTIARNDTEILKMLEEQFHLPNDVNNLEKEHDELVPKINNEYVNSTAEVDVIQNGNAFSTNSPDSIVSISEDSVGTKDTFDKLLKTTFPSVESLLDAIKDVDEAENPEAEVNGCKEIRKTEEKLDNVDVVPESINLKPSTTEDPVSLKEQPSENITPTQEKQQEQEEGNKEPDFDEMREEVVREFNNLCDSFQSENDENNDKYVEGEDVTNYQDIVDELEKSVVENRDDSEKADDIRESQDLGTIEGDLPERPEATKEVIPVDRPKSVEGTETITLDDSPKSLEANEETTLGDVPKSLEGTETIILGDSPKRVDRTETITLSASPKESESTEETALGASPKSSEATEETKLEEPPTSLEGTEDITLVDRPIKLEAIEESISEDPSKSLEATEETTLGDSPKSLDATEDIRSVDAPKRLEATEESISEDPTKSLEATEESISEDPPKRLETTKHEISSDESFKTADDTPKEVKLESETESCEKETESDQNISESNEQDKQQNNSESTSPPISPKKELEESQEEVEKDKQQIKNNPESPPPPISSQQELQENQKEVEEDKQQTKNTSETIPPPISSQQELEKNQKEMKENVTSAVDTPKGNSDNIPVRRKVGRPKKRRTQNKESTAISNSPQDETIISGNVDSVSVINDAQGNKDDDKAQKETSYNKNNKMNSLEAESDTKRKKISNISPVIVKEEENSDEEPNLSHKESGTSREALTKTHSKPFRTMRKRMKVVESKPEETEDAKSSVEISEIKENRKENAKRTSSRRKTMDVVNPTEQSKNNKETLLEKQNLTISPDIINSELNSKDNEITSSKNYSEGSSLIKVRKRGRPKNIDKLEKNTKNNEENIQERSSTEAVKQQLTIEDKEIQNIPKKKGRPSKVQRNIQRVSESKEEIIEEKKKSRLLSPSKDTVKGINLEKRERKIIEEKRTTRLSQSKDTVKGKESTVDNSISKVDKSIRTSNKRNRNDEGKTLEKVVKRGRGRPPKNPSIAKINESPANLHKNKRSDVERLPTRITRRSSEIKKELSNKKSRDITPPRTREIVSRKRIGREDSFNDKKENKRKRKYPSSDNSIQDEENSGNDTEKTSDKDHSPLRKSRKSLDKSLDINLNKQKKKLLTLSPYKNNIKDETKGMPILKKAKKRGRPRKQPSIDNKKVMIFKRGRGRPRNRSRSDERYYCKIEEGEDLNPSVVSSPLVVLKKIGRPRKSLTNNNFKKINDAGNDVVDIDDNETRLPKRGRPPKYKKKTGRISMIRNDNSYSKESSNSLHKRKADSISDVQSNVTPRRKRQKISEKHQDDDEEEILFKQCFLNWKPPDQSTITEQLYNNNNNTPMVKIENFVPDMAIEESGALSKIPGPSNNNNNNISSCSTETINQQCVKTEFSENLDKLKMLYDDVHFFNSLLPYIESLSEKERFIFKLKIQKITTEMINKSRKCSSL